MRAHAAKANRIQRACFSASEGLIASAAFADSVAMVCQIECVGRIWTAPASLLTSKNDSMAATWCRMGVRKQSVDGTPLNAQ